MYTPVRLYIIHMYMFQNRAGTSEKRLLMRIAIRFKPLNKLNREAVDTERNKEETSIEVGGNAVGLGRVGGGGEVQGSSSAICIIW
jgi:hypothetical protein